MAPRIQTLSNLVVNQIAAGEVIERPASVVKELLENSVDAGASRIEIEVEKGGQDLIRLVDDGCGIYPEDLPLAFASHATSKLAAAEDLFAIGTFGFRGEALASIGGVAQVTLQSRPTQAEQGAMIECRGSTLSPVRAWNGAIGTRIEVRNLFFNTPVRRKFLRTPGTEMGHISEAIIRLALAFPCCDDQPGLNLVLRHNGKVVHDIPSTTTLRDRVERFFGPEVSASLLPVIGEAGPVRLRGFVADPSCDRGNSRTQYLYVNGRWIRDRNLGHALQESYRGLLMTGRYAVAFLFLDMPPDQVDVNVHPTKSEVRFRQVSSLHHLVYTAVKKALGHTALIPNLQLPSSMQTGSFQAARPVAPPLMVHPPEVFSRPMTSNADDPIQQRTPPIREEDWIQSRTGPTREQVPLQPFPERGPPPLESLDRALFPPPRSARAIQLYDAYLVVETDEGMLVIDQHALHERILFEQIQKRLREKTLPSQPLLIPEPIDLPSGMAAQLLEHESTLAELGLGIEEFGGDTVLLTRYPLILEKRSPRETLLAVVDHLAQQDRLPTRDVFLNDLVSVMACHSAVRSGERLSTEQMDELLAQRHLADNTHHCPHGRPTSLLFSRQELDRQFRRT